MKRLVLSWPLAVVVVLLLVTQASANVTLNFEQIKIFGLPSGDFGVLFEAEGKVSGLKSSCSSLIDRVQVGSAGLLLPSVQLKNGEMRGKVRGRIEVQLLEGLGVSWPFRARVSAKPQCDSTGACLFTLNIRARNGRLGAQLIATLHGAYQLDAKGVPFIDTAPEWVLPLLDLSCRK